MGLHDTASPDIACNLDRTSTKTLRHLVRSLLDRNPGVPVGDALLVTDELASNALRHGEAPRRCRLWWFAQRRVLRIEIDDGGPGHPRMGTPDSAGGRGLVLVDRLARWGVHRTPQNKTVWAEMEIGDRTDTGQLQALLPSSRPDPD